MKISGLSALFCRHSLFELTIASRAASQEKERGEGASSKYDNLDNLIPLDWPATTDGQELVLLPLLLLLLLLLHPKPSSPVMEGWLVISRCVAPPIRIQQRPPVSISSHQHHPSSGSRCDPPCSASVIFGNLQVYEKVKKWYVKYHCPHKTKIVSAFQFRRNLWVKQLTYPILIISTWLF